MLKRFMLFMLCFCVAVAPAFASSNGVYGRKADAGTIDTWEMYFGDQVLSTDNAGKVWTDKSVYAADTAASQLPQRWGNWKNSLVDDEGDNFLIALSAMASNKSIVGRETIPTDTIFVLDMSSSMHDGTKLNPTVIQTMADATNNAIKALYELNVANRAGIVLYYGGGDVTVQSKEKHGIELLPLGRYTADKDQFIEVKTVKQNNVAQLSDIVVSDSVKYQGTDKRPSAGNYQLNDNKIAGTYAQRGIQIASDMFESATTVVSQQEDEHQAGKHRKPILILMTDGLPTAATHAYANVQDAYWGNNANGERTDAETDFVTQLTAALTKERMANHYDKQTPLVYTMGLALTTASPLAMDVLDPKGQDNLYAKDSTALQTYSIYTKRANTKNPNFVNTPAAVNRRIDELWHQLVAQGQVSFKALASTGNINWQALARPGGNDPQVKKVTVSGKKGSDQSDYTIAGFPASVDKKYYVDQYFPVQTAERLTDAFE
ncbi:MAG: VWA domain-containing protein, partial [Clostridia bacterium]|nr:VWA domain-containing protein [Clostridia bacterium]